MDRRLRVLAGGVIGLVLLIGLAACSGEESKLEKVYVQAAGGPGGGRAAAATTLRAEFYAKEITAVSALNLAHDKMEKVGDANSLAFAAAVLSFLDQVEPDIDREKVNEFFWMRIGTLAANAAAKAQAAGDTADARALVLAGPDRWQTDGYWMQNPGHDAMASLLMYQNGEGAEALSRLRDRPQLADEPATAMAEIEKGMRRGGGRK